MFNKLRKKISQLRTQKAEWNYEGDAKYDRVIQQRERLKKTQFEIHG